MKIVLIGIGKIGRTILADCSNEDHTITIIDEKKEVVESMIEKYDVLGVVGNGARMDIQKEAQVNEADIVIALTKSDELNILACLVAKKLGVPNTVARVRNPYYREQIMEMQDELGISMILNPELETAHELFNLINLPSVVQIEKFARGRVNLVEVVMEKGCPLIGETLISAAKKFRSKVLICAVQRNEDVFIPSGNCVIEENDKIHFTADAKVMGEFLRELHLVKAPIKNILIVGAGRIGYYLADALSKSKCHVKLIEQDKQLAESLAEQLPNTCIVNGDGTSHEVLLEEGIEAMDAFITLTGIDEENIVASIFAKEKGVRRIFTKIDRDDLFWMFEDVEAHTNVSEKNLVANKVLRYVRALSNTRGSNIVTLHRLVNNRVEALEFAATKDEPFYNIPLKDLSIRKNCLLACIIRNDKVMIPDGSSVITQNDSVVVVTTQKHLDDLADIFQ